MDKKTRIEEPAVDRWSDGPDNGEKRPQDREITIPLFGLSGGVMRASARTANRIDGLLTRMLESPTQCRYSPNIDQNLEYLMTYLQLDVINMIAHECMGKQSGPAESQQDEDDIADPRSE